MDLLIGAGPLPANRYPLPSTQYPLAISLPKLGRHKNPTTTPHKKREKVVFLTSQCRINKHLKGMTQAAPADVAGS